jgi:hypothetical protein
MMDNTGDSGRVFLDTDKRHGDYSHDKKTDNGSPSKLTRQLSSFRLFFSGRARYLSWSSCKNKKAILLYLC